MAVCGDTKATLDPSALARRVLAQLEAVGAQAPELGAELGLARRVPDGALGELDDVGLIQVRGGSRTCESHVEPTELAIASQADANGRKDP